MKISVTFLDAGLRLASLRVEATWWEALLGRRSGDELVIAVPALQGGTIWVRDSTGRRINDRRVVDELERQQARASAELRLRAALQRT